jgi:hypothetical protein
MGVKHTIEHLDQKSSQSNLQILNGWYIAESHTDTVIEIKTNQYCGANLETGSIECDPISDLKYIKPGVVKLGEGEDSYFVLKIFSKLISLVLVNVQQMDGLR